VVVCQYNWSGPWSAIQVIGRKKESIPHISIISSLIVCLINSLAKSQKLLPSVCDWPQWSSVQLTLHQTYTKLKYICRTECTFLLLAILE